MRSQNKSSRQLPPLLFTMFWVAQAVSLFGDRLNNFSLVALINRFASKPGLTLSKVYLAMYLPVFALAPVIGVLLDRLNKRWVLVVTDLLRGTLVFFIPLLFIRTGSFFPVLAVVFLLAIGNLFFLPAKSGLIPELVPGDRLIRVNSILWTAGIVGVIGGFLGGGFIFDYLSWPACFYVDGLTYLLSAVLLTGIAVHGRKKRSDAVKENVKRPSLFAAIREGLIEIRRAPAIIFPLGIQALIFFGAGGFSVLAIVLIKEASPSGSSLGLSVAGLSIGLGMGLGSLLTHRLYVATTRQKQTEYLLLFCLVPSTAVVASGWGFLAIGVGTFMTGLVTSPLFIISESDLQRVIASDVRGRVFSFREILTRSLFLISAFSFTILGELLGKDILLFLLGLFLATTGVIWIRLSPGTYDGHETTMKTTGG